MFKRKKKPTPEVSTASLPDIIFMLLFFFMTVTVLRSSTAKVPIALPDSISADKVAHEANEYNIFIGQPKDAEDVVIQINDYIVSEVQLDKVLQSVGAGLMDFEKLKVPIYLRVDKKTKMDVVYKVKLLLRKHGLRKINYIVKSGIDK